METWEIGDIVAYTSNGESRVGLIEEASGESYSLETSYAIRMLAQDANGAYTVVTDSVEQISGADVTAYDAMYDLAKEIEVEVSLEDDIETEETEETDEDITEEMDEKADVSELSIGDFVRWESAGGEAQGRIEDIHTSPYTVPDTDFTIDGSEDNPAYQIEVYDRREGGWVASGITVGHHADALTRTEPLETGETKRYPRYVGKVKNAEVTEDSAIGHIKGYLSVAENVDLGGDVVKRGAFKQTLNHKNGKTVFMLDHGYKTSEVIGVLNLTEDDMGLKMDGCINLATPQGKMAFDTAKFQVEQGVPIGASIGYEIVKSSPNKYGGYDLHEVKLYEGSMTPFPMNESALITEARKRYDRKYRKARALSLMGDAPKGNPPPSDDITDADILNALKLK